MTPEKRFQADLLGTIGVLLPSPREPDRRRERATIRKLESELMQMLREVAG